MSPEARRIYNISSNDPVEINRVLADLADRLDQLEGYRGKGDFKTIPSSSESASGASDLLRYGQSGFFTDNPNATLTTIYFLRVNPSGTILAQKGDASGVSIIVDPNGNSDTSHYRISDSRLTDLSIGICQVSELAGSNYDGVLETVMALVIPGTKQMEVHVRNSATGAGSIPRHWNILVTI